MDGAPPGGQRRRVQLDSRRRVPEKFAHGPIPIGAGRQFGLGVRHAFPGAIDWPDLLVDGDGPRILAPKRLTPAAMGCV